jgi:hypothetical protein
MAHAPYHFKGLSVAHFNFSTSSLIFYSAVLSLSVALLSSSAGPSSGVVGKRNDFIAAAGEDGGE